MRSTALTLNVSVTQAMKNFKAKKKIQAQPHTDSSLRSD